MSPWLRRGTIPARGFGLLERAAGVSVSSGLVFRPSGRSREGHHEDPVVAASERVETGSDHTATFRHAFAKPLQRHALRSPSWPDQPYLMMARYYSSGLARFLSTDPSRRSANAMSPQTWNRYTYARNNPIAYFDPNGEDAQIFIVNATSGATRSSFSMSNVATAVQSKFDNAGAKATVHTKGPSKSDFQKADKNGDIIHVVVVVDGPGPKEEAPYKSAHGHGAGTTG